jgi:hypothetical protein
LKRVNLFVVILGVSFIGFAISLYALTITYQAQSTSSFMSDMMRNMMGGMMEGMPVSEPVEVPMYLWILPSVFVGLLILGVGGLLYFLMVPEIRLSYQDVTTPAAPTSPAFRGEKVSTLLNTMKPDEKKVFEVLASHDGKYLQKHISREADLSRLKTHRIIARFAERGIVTVRPYGNTNEVALSSWLKSEE